MNKPNLFDYATSELSQDAVICWMIKCADCDDAVLKEFSREFIRSIFNLFNYDSVNLKCLSNVEVKKQYKNIDIFVLLHFNQGKTYPLIIEDKTYTSEHDNQLDRYIHIIEKENANNEEYASPIGLYYKSGYIYDEEEENALNSGYKIYTGNMMLKLMGKYLDRTDSDIFHDYYNYLSKVEGKITEIKQIIDNDDMEEKSMKKVLDSYDGQWILMKKIFENTNEGCEYNGSSYGRPWTQYKIVKNHDRNALADDIFFRVDWRKGGYYISLRQYLDYGNTQWCLENLKETDKTKLLNEKMLRLKELKKCFNSAMGRMQADNNGNILVAGKTVNKKGKECEIGVFFINEANTFQKIIRFIPEFSEAFEDEMKKKFNLII